MSRRNNYFAPKTFRARVELHLALSSRIMLKISGG
jgi:hypothetical protein